MFGLSSYELFGAIFGIAIAAAPVVWWAARLDQRVSQILQVVNGHRKRQRITIRKVRQLQESHQQHARRIQQLEARPS